MYQKRKIQQLLEQAVIEQDNGLLKEAMSCGAQVNNGINNEKNTLNQGIIMMIRNNTKKFNLSFITDLIDYGATAIIGVKNNTLIITINQAIESLNKNNDSKMTESFCTDVLNLVKLLITKIPKLINKSSSHYIQSICVKYTMRLIVHQCDHCNHWPWNQCSATNKKDYTFDLIDLLFKITQTNKNSDLLAELFTELVAENLCSHSDNKIIILIHRLISVGLTKSNDHNILPMCIEYARKRAEMYCEKNEIEKNMCELVKILIQNGVPVSLKQDSTNTLSCAFRSKNQGIIDMIIGMQSLPDNRGSKEYPRYYNYNTHTINLALNDSTIKNHNTLTTAVNTKNVYLVELALSCGAEPDIANSENNTLAHAIKVADLGIIRLILLHGGRTGCNELLSIFIELFIMQKICRDMEKINQILDLILCSNHYFSYGNTKERSRSSFYIDTTVLNFHPYLADCWELLNQDSPYLNKEITIKRLKSVMDGLLDKKSDKSNKVNVIENIIMSMPTCCIEIIYEYQYIEPKIDYIDWTQYIEPKIDYKIDWSQVTIY